MARSVYLAAGLSKREEMRALAMILQERGHIVTSDWIYKEDQHEETTPGERMNNASRDIWHIDSSDTLVFFSGPSTHGGKHFELGYAFAIYLHVRNSMECIVVGEQGSVFHYLPGIKVVEDVGELLRYLDGPMGVR